MKTGPKPRNNKAAYKRECFRINEIEDHIITQAIDKAGVSRSQYYREAILARAKRDNKK